MSVTKGDVVSANRYLTDAETMINAEYVARALTRNGWTLNAIAATLANMEHESGINPGIYESLDATSTTNGFGLVQWTPNTKYKTWADANNYAYGDIDGQIKRIIYELENGLQWIETDAYPISFEEYSKSMQTPGWLAYAFMYNYERPASLDQPSRQSAADIWYDEIGRMDLESDPTPTPTPSTTKSMSRLLFLYAGSRKR